MSLIKLKQKGQITLPAEIRQHLDLSEGDVLEAAVENGRIILSPKLVIDRAEAFKRMRLIGTEARQRWEAEGKTEEDMERLIGEAVENVRTEQHPKQSKS